MKENNNINEATEMRRRETAGPQRHTLPDDNSKSGNNSGERSSTGRDPFLEAIEFPRAEQHPGLYLQTIEDLLERDNQREADGFPRRIRLGKIARPDKQNKQRVIVVPTTTEPKFYHDNSILDEEGQSGGTGEEAEGEVIGEAMPEDQQGEGEGAGQGGGGEGHDVSSDAYELGKVLTEKFQLPNLKQKGNKKSLTKYQYDLTDRNRGFGQLIDKKDTIRRIIKTNIVLGNIESAKPFDPEDLLINPKDKSYRILSKEKAFETQALVFFLRDYSGSMQGAPTEAVSTQHLFIYSWLMYQYQNNVESRFILHDQEAKEVPDFYTYHNSSVAGGTNVFPAFELVNKIVEEEQLARDYNIYVFHGTDGDDWDASGQQMLAALRKMLLYSNRVGISVAKNSWGSTNAETAVERYINNSTLLKEQSELLKMDSFAASGVSEERLIEGIRKLVE